MATTSRTDAELHAWLTGIRCEQAGNTLDAYADLWLANDEARAIKDKASPAASAVHQRINALLDRIVGA